ncbi:TetR/AcrR family transcriptional regulator [Streptomyces sp. NPDC002580]|uniref:TetR/AcrR family transcriptional regulator n=1 Tax=Streptomyces sp. NPDC002580 TaxID=3364653 RepID=UPI003677C53C
MFAEHGHHGTGMAQLGAAVGLQRGGLYHRIGNKEALLFEIGASQLRVMVEIALDIEKRVEDPEERFREPARTLMEDIADHVLERTVHYRDFTALTGPLMESVLDLRKQCGQVWPRTLDAAIDAGHFRPMPESVALKGILGMFNHSYVWLKKDAGLLPREIADLFRDTFLTGTLRSAPRKDRTPRRPGL